MFPFSFVMLFALKSLSDTSVTPQLWGQVCMVISSPSFCFGLSVFLKCVSHEQHILLKKSLDNSSINF